MAISNSIPAQLRAVDPYASYNSDTVNKLTRMLTYGDDGIANAVSCDVTLDTTSTNKVIMAPGQVYKDDVWIDIESQHTVDFTDEDQYYNFDTGFDETGWYYVVLQYVFQKQRPAPEARILIVKPSQRSVYSPGGDWIFLKAVNVTSVGPGVIGSVSDFDPDNPDNERLYVKMYAGTVSTLPTFDPTRDPSRVVLNKADNEFYFGYVDRWGGASEGGDNIEADTSGFTIGDLVYITGSGTIALANAGLGVTTADGVVEVVGTSGRVKLSGRIEGVKMEPGINMSVGNLAYLSKTVPSTITKFKTTPFHQFVGRCVATDGTTTTILFVRGEPGGGEGIADLATYVYNISDSTAWVLSSGMYYQDFDVSDIADGHSTLQIWDDVTKLTVYPPRIDCLSGTLRVWMPNNTSVLHVLAIGPSSGTMLGSNVGVITETLLPGGWLGAGPFYQQIDVSVIDNEGAVVNVKENTSQELVVPSDIEFDSTSLLTIWMPSNTETLDVVVMGPITSTSTLFGLNVTLASGISWIPDSGMYYQDVSLVVFGDSDVTIGFVDFDSMEYIEPANVEFIDGGLTARIWMPTDTVQVNVTIIG